MGKGYGFVTFRDATSAETAIRTLAGFEMRGRPLTVKSAAAKGDPAPRTRERRAAQKRAGGGAARAPQRASNQVAEVLKKLPKSEVFEIVRQMKALVHRDPAGARAVLLQYPQVAQAMLQSMLMIGMLGGSRTPTGGMGGASSAPGAAPPAAKRQRRAGPGDGAGAGGGAGGGAGAGAGAAMAPDQSALLETVMAMSEEDIKKLGPAEQAQVRAIREQAQKM